MSRKVAILVSLSLSFTGLVHASEVDIPNTFSSGTAAVAAEVNENFSELETAVDDNYALIQSLQTLVTSLQSSVNDLQLEVSNLNDQLDALNLSSVARIMSPRSRNNSFDDFDIEDSKGVFTIEFNVAIDTSSVAVGDNVIISGSSGDGSATIEWRDDNATMVLTTIEDFIILSPCFSGGLTLEILGNGSDPILDAQGKAIDGNNDGLPGGNWTDEYDIIC